MIINGWETEPQWKPEVEEMSKMPTACHLASNLAV